MKDRHDLPRLLSLRLRSALDVFPVVVLTGARQTGKSTLAQSLPGSRTYLTLDDLDILERARREPDALTASAELVTLDEVQRSPDLLLAVKRRVDRRRVPGQFLLTGSANLLLMKQVSESLAGRAVYLTLWPLTPREQRGLGTTGDWSRLFEVRPEEWLVPPAGEDIAEDWRALCRRGGYPTPAYELDDDEARAMWFDGYARTYLERDLADLSAVASALDFRRLMRAAMLRAGNLLNQADLARDVGLSPATVHRHLDLMELSYQIVRLPAYSVNRTRRLIKGPKVYAADVGFGLHLSGAGEATGAHLENLILADLLAWQETVSDRPGLHYWRTASGHEVDFVIEWKGRLLPIEVKASTRLRLEHCASLALFREEYPESSLPGILLHAGSEAAWIRDDVLALPWWRLV